MITEGFYWLTNTFFDKVCVKMFVSQYHMKDCSYSCGHIITDTWNVVEYEIKLDCVWYYSTAHTHVSAVSFLACEPFRNNDTVVEPHTKNLELLYWHSTNARVWKCIKTHSSVNDNAATAVRGVFEVGSTWGLLTIREKATHFHHTYTTERSVISSPE